MSYYPDKVTIVVRENFQIKGSAPSNGVVAKLKFDGFMTQEAVGKLVHFLATKIYSQGPVRFDVQTSGTND